MSDLRTARETDRETAGETAREMLEVLDQTMIAPRPLALHLAIQNMTYASSLAGLKGLRNGSIDWKASLRRRAKRLAEDLRNIDEAAFQAAVAEELSARVAGFAAGVDKFRDAPRPAAPSALPTVWSEGTTRVIRAEGAGPPVILIPSLINRAHILDLAEDRSLLRFFAAKGLDAYLVDWDAPGEEELGFDLEDYIGRLERIRDHVREATGKPPAVLGYCMGGLLALALAHRDQDKIDRLALLATPWDFSEVPQSAVACLAASMPLMDQTVAAFGMMPVDVLQAMFVSLDPGGSARKFRRFAEMDVTGSEAQRFIQLEDWINDGVPLAPKVALQCLKGWYVENAPANGKWRDGGQTVDPTNITIPSLVVVPNGDRIVPPASASPLANLCCNAAKLDVKAGHIGMISGASAVKQVYEPLYGYFAGAKK